MISSFPSSLSGSGTETMPSISSVSFHVHTKLVSALCGLMYLSSSRPSDFWRWQLIWCLLRYIGLCSSVSIVLESDSQSRREVFSQKDSSLKEGKRLARLPKGEYLPACVCWGKQHVTELVVGRLSFPRKDSPVSCLIHNVNWVNPGL